MSGHAGPLRTAQALPAVQARSQHTRDRLLDAAEALLAAGGLEAATVPGIARKARVAVGSVYRRFPDKDAVLQSVYERFFTRSVRTNREALAEDRWRHVALPEMVRSLLDGMVRGYNAHGALLAALMRYADAHPDPRFRAHAEELRSEAFAGIRRLLLSRRAEIGHPDPEQAVEFLFVTLGLALKGFLLNRDRLGAAISWPRISTELTRMALEYLRAAPSPPHRA